jgi:hypothetical protein
MDELEKQKKCNNVARIRTISLNNGVYFHIGYLKKTIKGSRGRLKHSVRGKFHRKGETQRQQFKRWREEEEGR